MENHGSIRNGLLLAAFFSVSALAHSQAEPRAATPAPGSIVPAPTEISIVFSEPLSAQTSNIYVTTNSDTPVTRASAFLDPNNQAHMVLPLPRLQPGRYSVHWVALGVDGRRSENQYKFTVPYPVR